jgi:hypothetical protein
MMGELVALKAGSGVGDVIAIAGGVVSGLLLLPSVPMPVMSREIVSESTVKLTLTVAVVDVVGVKRTVTSCVVPCPARLNGLPETILKGPDVDTVPETAPRPSLVTVKTWSAELPILTVPKLTAVAGVTVT